MAYKDFDIEGIGTVTVYKRRGSTSLRLSIQPDGKVRVTVPTWTPYAAGVSFAQSRRAWIALHTTPAAPALHSGQAVGKQHQLLFLRSLESTRVSTRVTRNQIVIRYPLATTEAADAVQDAARKASVRALRVEAADLLPPRLADLAQLHGFSYGTVSVKPLKTRWGSCDQAGNITLNIYLMQLPWHLIDYVLLHELTHTKIMRHGPPFWAAMGQLLPKLAAIRKEMRGHRSTLLQG